MINKEIRITCLRALHLCGKFLLPETALYSAVRLEVSPIPESERAALAHYCRDYATIALWEASKPPEVVHLWRTPRVKRPPRVKADPPVPILGLPSCHGFGCAQQSILACRLCGVEYCRRCFRKHRKKPCCAAL